MPTMLVKHCPSASSGLFAVTAIQTLGPTTVYACTVSTTALKDTVGFKFPRHLVSSASFRRRRRADLIHRRLPTPVSFSAPPPARGIWCRIDSSGDGGRGAGQQVCAAGGGRRQLCSKRSSAVPAGRVICHITQDGVESRITQNFESVICHTHKAASRYMQYNALHRASIVHFIFYKLFRTIQTCVLTSLIEQQNKCQHTDSLLFLFEVINDGPHYPTV